MQGLRKIFRALGIVLLTAGSLWLFVDAGLNGATDHQLLIAVALMMGAVGLAATWFWTAFG